MLQLVESWPVGGGTGGKAFDDAVDLLRDDLKSARISQIDVCVGSAEGHEHVSAIKVTYALPDGRSLCSDWHGGSRSSFFGESFRIVEHPVILGNDEIVTCVEGSSITIPSGITLVASLCFTISSGDVNRVMGPFGGQGFRAAIPFRVPGHVVAFAGRAGATLDALCVYLPSAV